MLAIEISDISRYLEALFSPDLKWVLPSSVSWFR